MAVNRLPADAEGFSDGLHGVARSFVTSLERRWWTSGCAARHLAVNTIEPITPDDVRR
jgi:hypothetical protein